MKTPTALLRLNSARRQLDAAHKLLDLQRPTTTSQRVLLIRAARCADDCMQKAAKLRTALRELVTDEK